MVEELTLSDIEGTAVRQDTAVTTLTGVEDYLGRLERILMLISHILQSLQSMGVNSPFFPLLQQRAQALGVNLANQENNQVQGVEGGNMVTVDTIISGLEKVKEIYGDITISELIKLIKENRVVVEGFLRKV